MRALDEGLALFFDPQFFLLHRKFQRAMRMASTVTDMDERLNWSNRAFQVVAAISPGPLSRAEARTMGTLHAIRGQAYLELRARDYASFSRLAVSDLEAATTYLKAEDDTYWSQAMNLLSSAYFENVDGNPADNIENAIKTAEAALSAIDPLLDRGVWIEIVHNLAGYHESRIYGVRRENKQKALSIMRRLHAVVSVQFDALE